MHLVATKISTDVTLMRSLYKHGFLPSQGPHRSTEGLLSYKHVDALDRQLDGMQQYSIFLPGRRPFFAGLYPYQPGVVELTVLMTRLDKMVTRAT